MIRTEFPIKHLEKAFFLLSVQAGAFYWRPVSTGDRGSELGQGDVRRLRALGASRQPVYRLQRRRAPVLSSRKRRSPT